MGTEVGEGLAAFFREKGDGEAVVAFQEFVGEAVARHVDRDDGFVPQFAQRAPGDGHGVHVAGDAGGDQRPVLVEQGDGVGLDFGRLDFAHDVVVLAFRLSAAHYYRGYGKYGKESGHGYKYSKKSGILAAAATMAAAAVAVTAVVGGVAAATVAAAALIGTAATAGAVQG